MHTKDEELPEGLQEILERLGAKAIRLGDDRPSKEPRLATREEAQEFLSGVEYFSVGDIVKWRPGYKSSPAPHYDEECVVTQMLDTPARLLNSNLIAAERLDLGLAFMHTVADDPDGHDRLLLSDVLFDSRRFYKVGSIYD